MQLLRPCQLFLGLIGVCARAGGCAAPQNLVQAAFKGQCEDRTPTLFVTNRDESWELYTTNPDGSGALNLTRHPANDFRGQPSYGLRGGPQRRTPGSGG